MDKRLDKYRKKAICPISKKEVNYLSKEAEAKYLEDEGIMKDEHTVKEHSIGRFIDHNKKMELLKNHKDKVEYAKQKEDEELDVGF